METYYLLLGVFTGLLTGVFGIGGGIFSVPILSNLVSAHSAIVISSMQMVFSSAFGSAINVKNKKFNIKDGITLGIGGSIGASFSGLLATSVSEITLMIAFLTIVSFSFYKLIRGSEKIPGEAEVVHVAPIKKGLVLISLGLVTGLLAMALGIGGSVILSPLLSRFLGLNSKQVVPLSMCFVLFSSTSGVYSFYGEGVVSKDIAYYGTIFGLSSMVGVTIGFTLINRISLKYHKIGLASIFLVSIFSVIVKILREQTYIVLP